MCVCGERGREREKEKGRGTVVAGLPSGRPSGVLRGVWLPAAPLSVLPDCSLAAQPTWPFPYPHIPAEPLTPSTQRLPRPPPPLLLLSLLLSLLFSSALLFPPLQEVQNVQLLRASSRPPLLFPSCTHACTQTKDGVTRGAVKKECKTKRTERKARG